MTKVLVSGGAGMIGSHVCEHYAKDKENEVICLDNLSRSKWFSSTHASVEHNVKYLQEKYPNNLKFLLSDVRYITPKISDALVDCDLIVHTAANPGVPTSVKDPLLDFENNAKGTVNMLELARTKCDKATFVYCSTNKVYGENVDDIPVFDRGTRYDYPNSVDGITEGMSVDQTGHTPYGCSKYVGDLYTQEYAKIYGMRTGVFRMSCIYGPRQFGFEDQGWFAWFIIAALTKQPINIFGDGKQVRDALHARDVAIAYDTFFKSKVHDGVWNLGGGEKNSTSLNEFIAVLEKQLNLKMEYSMHDWRPSDQKVYITDTTKIKKELGWEPSISIKEGINELIAWAKDNVELFTQ